MPNGHQFPEDDAPKATRSLITIPAATDLPPPRPADVNTQMKQLVRDIWDEEFVPTLQILNGESAPSPDGNAILTEHRLVFKLEAMIKENGLSALAPLNAARLKRAMRVAIKEMMEGVSVKQIVAQGRRLLLEHKTATKN